MGASSSGGSEGRAAALGPPSDSGLEMGAKQVGCARDRSSETWPPAELGVPGELDGACLTCCGGDTGWCCHKAPPSRANYLLLPVETGRLGLDSVGAAQWPAPARDIRGWRLRPRWQPGVPTQARPSDTRAAHRGQPCAAVGLREEAAGVVLGQGCSVDTGNQRPGPRGAVPWQLWSHSRRGRAGRSGRGRQDGASSFSRQAHRQGPELPE